MAYLNNSNDVFNYLMKEIPIAPKPVEANFSKYLLSNCIIDLNINITIPNLVLQDSEAFLGAKEYSIYGWAKWTDNINITQNYYILFRLT